MQHDNLPAGVTQRDIDQHFGKPTHHCVRCGQVAPLAAVTAKKGPALCIPCTVPAALELMATPAPAWFNAWKEGRANA